MAVAGTSTEQECGIYLKEFIKLGRANNPVEVRKLQAFLIVHENEKGLKVTGTYDLKTYEAVKRFQAKYSNGVLNPWGISEPTGYVYITTRIKINRLYCGLKTDLKLDFLRLGR